jgi:hypothetical protein
MLNKVGLMQCSWFVSSIAIFCTFRAKHWIWASQSRRRRPSIIKTGILQPSAIWFRVLDIGTYRTCKHWPKCLVTACCWLALAVSSFSVYILTGKDNFQVVRARWPSGIVGSSDPRGSWFDSHSCKRDFFLPSGRHVRSFCFFRMILVRLASELLN